MPNISLSEVAEHCGVSIATVSRVLNNSQSVRPETADLVWKSVRHLQDSSPLRRLRVVPELLGGGIETATVSFLGTGSFARLLPIFLEVLSGISSELQTHGIKMLLSEVGSPASAEALLQSQKPEAAIAFVNRQEWSEADLADFASRIPTVWVMGASTSPAVVDHVFPDNIAIGNLAFNYLRTRKCNRVAYVFLPVFSTTMSTVSQLRAMSFLSAARMQGVQHAIYAVGDAQEPAIRSLGGNPIVAATTAELVGKLLADEPRGTGLFLSTDQETALLYHTMAANRSRPDEDYPIVSCDNEAPTLASLRPRPATIDFGARMIGQQAVRQLMHRARNPSEPPLLLQLPPRLVLPDDQTM